MHKAFLHKAFLQAPDEDEFGGISQAEAQAAGAAVAGGTSKTKIGTSLYYLEGSGGAGLKLFWMQDEVATVMFGFQGQVAKVMEINTHNLYQRQGMGKLLAACLFGFCEARGATIVGLGTQDTSGGFWSQFGLSQSNTKRIVELWVTLGPVIDVPRKAVPKATDGIDRSKKSLW